MKLSDKSQVVKDFNTCNICGTTYNDICSLNLWREYTSDDKPTDKYVVVCKSAKCQKAIDDHELPYSEVPWSAGGPGRFTLICGKCTHRNGFECTNPNLKQNGGSGLEISFTRTLLSGIHLCYEDGRSWTMPHPATSCAGQSLVEEKK